MPGEEKGTLFIRKWSCNCRIEDGFSAKISTKSGRSIVVKIKSSSQHINFSGATKDDAEFLTSTRFNVVSCDDKNKVLFLSEI